MTDVHLPRLIAEAFSISTSEARRGISQGAVRLDGKVETRLDVPEGDLAGTHLQLGQQRFVTLDDCGAPERPSVQAARIEVMLMREFLPSREDRPELEDCVWLMDVPWGPSPQGIAALRAVQAHYGVPHVTTANPSKGAKGRVCGIYVRQSAVDDAPNFLSEYLSSDDG